jgi:hypothetical protein
MYEASFKTTKSKLNTKAELRGFLATCSQANLDELQQSPKLKQAMTSGPNLNSP